MQYPNEPLPSEERLRSARTAAIIVYLLQALSFFNGLTFLAAVVVDYIKLDDVRGTWLETHYRWQIRTFWWTVLWSIVGAITSIILIGYLIIVATVIWVIYRVAKGWLLLNENRPVG